MWTAGTDSERARLVIAQALAQAATAPSLATAATTLYPPPVAAVAWNSESLGWFKRPTHRNAEATAQAVAAALQRC